MPVFPLLKHPSPALYPYNMTEQISSYFLEWGGMDPQNQIKRALSKPESIEYVGQLLGEEEFSRKELAEFVCQQFGFQDPRGQNQLGGCLKALRELESKSWFQLPIASDSKRQAWSEPKGVPGEVGEVRGLKLILVAQESQMRIWTN